MEISQYLGHDISEIMRTRIWGSGVVNQVSLDLRAAFPEAKGFSKDNLYRMGQFYRFYSAQNELWHKLCDNYNLLKIRRILLWHKLCHKFRTRFRSIQKVFLTTTTANCAMPSPYGSVR